MRKVPSDAVFFFGTGKCLGPGGALETVPFSVDSSADAVVRLRMFIEACQKLSSSQYSRFSMTKFSETKNYNKHINSEIRKLEFVLI